MTFFSHCLKWLLSRKSGSTAVPVQPLTSQSRKPIRFLKIARRAKPMVQPIRLQKTARQSHPQRLRKMGKLRARNCMRPKPWLTPKRLNSVRKMLKSVLMKRKSVLMKRKNVLMKRKNVLMKQKNVLHLQKLR